MTTKYVLSVMVGMFLLAQVGSAQSTVAEQMQRAIYAQETAGNLDVAIQIYRQILNSSPTRAYGAQAQFHLATALLQKGDLNGAAEALQVLSRNYPESKDSVAAMAAQVHFLNQSSREYGILADGRFHHFLTGVELTIPDGYEFGGCGTSSGNGEQAYIQSKSKPDVSVWMKPVVQPTADLRAEVRKQMIRKPADRGEGWKERPESAQERTFSGQPGISVVADYMHNGTQWVEYLIWIDTGKTLIQFRGQAEADRLAVLQDSVDRVANAAVIP